MIPVEAHLFLNHVPLIGSMFGLVFFVVGWMRASEQVFRAGLRIFIATALAVLMVVGSGLAAKSLLKDAAWLDRDALNTHQWAGIVTLIVLVWLGGLCGVALSTSIRTGLTVPFRARVIMLVLSLTGLGASAWTAYLGGVLRHSELGRGKARIYGGIRMSLDRETQELLKQIAAWPGDKVEPIALREANAALRARFGRPDMHRIDDVALQTASGDIRLRVLVPSGVVRGVFIWYHGGGWVVGSIENSDTLGRLLADETDCTVVLVDYRLAPEHRFPTAADDAYATFVWTANNLDHLAGTTVPIIVGGDSAGGNLAAVTAMRARDRNGPRVALQVLVVPVVDANFDTGSYVAPENQIGVWSRDAERWFWNQYVPRIEDRRHPDASPIHATQFSNLPPAVIVTAEHDVLRDEGEAYAEKLRQADVPVKLQRFAGQVHGFFVMVNILPGSALGRAFVVDAIAAQLAQRRRTE
jgi:acetyl esterase/lipase